MILRNLTIFFTIDNRFASWMGIDITPTFVLNHKKKVMTPPISCLEPNDCSLPFFVCLNEFQWCLLN